jgi:uncharacterized protein YraI
MNMSRGRASSSKNWKLLLASGAAALILAAAGAAKAYEAVVTSSAPLEAGPSPDYPQVDELDAGAPVTVYGCVNGYEWCDVSFQGARGWFDAQYLTVPYQGQQVPIFDYGVQIGLPVIGFSFDDYWGRYYHDRPFFGERERYAHVAPPPPRPHDDRAHEGRPGGATNRGEAPRGGPTHAAAPHPEANRGPAPRPEAHPAPPRPEAAHPAPRPEAARPAPHQEAPHPAEHPAEGRPAEHGEEHHE